MTPLEKLKALSNEYREECAKVGGNPRRPLDSLGCDMADLSGELLALWEAMNEPIDDDDHSVQLSLNMLNALDRLNAKAAEVLK